MRHLLLAAFCAAATTVGAEPLSRISVPLRIDLDGVEAWANEQIPRTVANKTKRVKCGTILWTDIFCNLEQKVARTGDFRLSGQESTLHATETFVGRAKLRGRGDIGKHISLSVKARLELTVSATPAIAPDWRLTAQVLHRYRWRKKPTMDFLGLIPITFDRIAEKEIDKAIAAFKRKDLQQALDEVKLRKEVAEIWAKAQVPHEIPLPGNRTAFLTFVPETVALAPLAAQGRFVETTLALEGSFEVSDVDPDTDPRPLPDLSDAPAAPGVSLMIPVDLGFETLDALVATTLPAEIDTSEVVRGPLTVTDVAFSDAGDGRLTATIEGSLARRLLGPLETRIAVTGRPGWSKAEATLRFADPVLALVGDGAGTQVLNALIDNRFVQAQLEQALTLSLADDIAALTQALNDEVFGAQGNGLVLTGALVPGVTALSVEDRVRLNMSLTGRLGVTAFASPAPPQ